MSYTDSNNPRWAELLRRAVTEPASYRKQERARRQGKVPGRPKRVFRRHEVVRLRDEERRSWRAIAAALDIPVMTAVDAYQCTEIVAPSEATSDCNDGTSVVASDAYATDRLPDAGKVRM